MLAPVCLASSVLNSFSVRLHSYRCTSGEEKARVSEGMTCRTQSFADFLTPRCVSIICAICLPFTVVLLCRCGFPLGSAEALGNKVGLINA